MSVDERAMRMNWHKFFVSSADENKSGIGLHTTMNSVQNFWKSLGISPKTYDFKIYLNNDAISESISFGMAYNLIVVQPLLRDTLQCSVCFLFRFWFIEERLLFLHASNNNIFIKILSDESLAFNCHRLIYFKNV